jgi:GTPase SAR1 family protein
MEEDILTTLKILIIGESGVGKSRFVSLSYKYIFTSFILFSLEILICANTRLLKHVYYYNA